MNYWKKKRNTRHLAEYVNLNGSTIILCESIDKRYRIIKSSVSNPFAEIQAKFLSKESALSYLKNRIAHENQWHKSAQKRK